MSTLGQTLRKYREMLPGPPTKANRFLGSQEHASINAVAHRAGIDPSYLHLLERDQRSSPYRHKVEALAVALELDEAETDQLMVAAGYWPFSDLEGDQLSELLRIGRRLVRLQDEREEVRVS